MLEELASAGRVVGFKQVFRAAKAGELVKVYLAQDADDKLKAQIAEAAAESGAELISVPGKKELGKACGINVAAACAGVLK